MWADRSPDPLAMASNTRHRDGDPAARPAPAPSNSQPPTRTLLSARAGGLRRNAVNRGEPDKGSETGSVLRETQNGCEGQALERATDEGDCRYQPSLLSQWFV